MTIVNELSYDHVPEREVGTPAGWARVLARQLTNQAGRVARYGRYYDGDHRLRFASDAWRAHYGGLFQEFCVNYCALVPDSVGERLQVDGFQIGQQPQADKAANKIWQRNGMDAVADTGHVESLYNSIAYHLVWPDDDDPSLATITLEHASEVVVALNPNNRRKRDAALKIYRDPWGKDQYQLWLRAGLTAPGTPAGFFRFEKGQSDQVAKPIGEGRPHNFGVPMIPIVPQPKTIGYPISEIHKVIPIQDALNKLLSDVIVISEALALPLRYILGWVDEAETTNRTDEAKIVKAAVSAKELLQSSLVTFPDPDTTVGQLPGADMGGHVGMLRELVQHIATLSRIPFHYFLMNGGNIPSGEAITSAEAGIIAVTRRRARHLGEGHEETMRTAFLIEGDTAKAAETSSEIKWANPATRSLAVEVDAAVKKGSAPILVPQRQLYEDLGYTPQQVGRFDALRALESLSQAILAPGTTPGAPGAQNGSQPVSAASPAGPGARPSPVAG
jgi:hypothetical protein